MNVTTATQQLYKKVPGLSVIEKAIIQSLFDGIWETAQAQRTRLKPPGRNRRKPNRCCRPPLPFLAIKPVRNA